MQQVLLSICCFTRTKVSSLLESHRTPSFFGAQATTPNLWKPTMYQLSERWVPKHLATDCFQQNVTSRWGHKDLSVFVTVPITHVLRELHLLSDQHRCVRLSEKPKPYCEPCVSMGTTLNYPRTIFLPHSCSVEKPSSSNPVPTVKNSQGNAALKRRMWPGMVMHAWNLSTQPSLVNLLRQLYMFLLDWET